MLFNFFCNMVIKYKHFFYLVLLIFLTSLLLYILLYYGNTVLPHPMEFKYDIYFLIDHIILNKIYILYKLRNMNELIILAFVSLN